MSDSWADTWLGRVMEAHKGPQPVPRSQVDAYSQQLRGELRSALRHAYLGPRCRPLLKLQCDHYSVRRFCVHTGCRGSGLAPARRWWEGGGRGKCMCGSVQLGHCR